MTTKLKIISIAWLINLVVFTVSLFLWNYYDHIDHWSESAWEAIYATSTLTKVALSLVGVALFLDGGLNKKS